MVHYRVETEDAIYIRNKPIIESNYKTFTPENLIKAVRNVKTGKVDLKTAAKRHHVPVRVIQRHMANWSKEQDTDKVYTDDTIKKHANIIICKTYAQYQKELSIHSKVSKMTTRITVTGAEKLDGIQYLRSTMRTNYIGIVQPGHQSKYLRNEEDEEKFIKTILDRLKLHSPMTHQEMLQTAKQIGEENGLNLGEPSRPWLYHMKDKYKPLFYGDQITIKIEVLDDKGIQFPINYENPVLQMQRNDKSVKPRKRKEQKRIEKSENEIFTPQWLPAVAPTTSSPTKMKFNFCRFCMASTYKSGERDIPDEFLRIFHHFYGSELEHLEDFPNKICIECHDQFFSFTTYLKNVCDVQLKIRELVNGRNVKIEMESLEFLEDQEEASIFDISPSITDHVAVKLEPPDEHYSIEQLDEFNNLTSSNNGNIVNIDRLSLNQPTTSKESFSTSTGKTPKKIKIIQPSKRISIENFTVDDFLKQSREKQFECDICGHKARKKVYMQGHIDRIHLMKSVEFQCPICGIICSSQSTYSRHKLVAHATTDAICDECGHVSKHLEALKRHKRKHHTEKISCSECGILVSAFFMKLHIRKHHNPVKCMHCDKVFQGRGQLAYHIGYVHENTGEVCPTCQSVLPNKTKLKLHMQRQHPTALFHCPVISCNYNSSRKPYIKLHLNHHRDISDDEKERLVHSLKSLQAIPID